MKRRWHRLLLLALLPVAVATTCKDEASRSRSGAGDARPETVSDSRGPAPVDPGATLEDAGPGEQDCDSSPVVTPNGFFATYGCRFIHHCYKVRNNGLDLEDKEIELCGADGACLFRVTHVCERWYLINDGTKDILVSSTTGDVLTHNRLHGWTPTPDADAGTVPDGAPIDPTPAFLELPVSARPR